jgi:membrane protease subunit (stomatin/prohibitin family)
MKLSSWTAPVLIAALITVTVCGLSLLAVRASVFSTATSLDLLRLQLRVARLQDLLIRHSQERLQGSLATAAPLLSGGGGAGAAGAAGAAAGRGAGAPATASGRDAAAETAAGVAADRAAPEEPWPAAAPEN